MKSKEIVLTLGYIAIFCIALYLVLGLLKMSGQGLSSMTGGPLIEGMTDRQREKMEKDIEDANTKIEAELENAKESKLVKSFINFDDTTGFDDFQENILTLINFNLEVKKNLLMSGFINAVKGKKRINFDDKSIQTQIDQINRLVKFKKFLEEHENIEL